MHRWRTPDAGTHGNVATPAKCLLNGTARKDQQIRLVDQVAMRNKIKYPTPTNSMVTIGDFNQAKFHSSKRPKYKDVNRVYPTPMSGNARHGCLPGSERIKRKKRQGWTIDLQDLVTIENPKQGQLNSDWVELLMGWPKNWTCIDPIS